ncbi:hypothetical protein H5410_015248 [Solanum commersonii]|uniref:F-box associated beta-propeller type 3 domain-containing protein n=1 Tax=Solanum commersonii TaxID=4109 RepID=A0A9J5ZTA9_SOLCO|nr:hypothetical protein H5410_015248 [Solanum commersonii]
MQIDNSRGHVRNFIFTLRIDKSWRKIKSIFDFFPSFSIKTCSIEGVIYMMDYLKKAIVAFDLRTENFRVIGLSDDTCKNIFDYDVIEVKRKIALLDCWGVSFGQNDLWILENSKRRFYDSRNGEIIFIAMKNSILFCNFYDVDKNSWRHLEIHGAPTEDEIYELIIEIFLWLLVMSLMRFRCVSKFFDALVLDSYFTHVHYLRFMTRGGGTKFLIGKTEDLYALDLNENGNTSRWNFDCHDQYFNG